jgi:AcrR family transcriptional regulator
MLNKGPKDTKLKIMETAFELFGKFGFEGTSVRAISKKSKVNLAALNYHFLNKENLFWEIMGAIHLDLEKQVHEYFLTSKDTKELAMHTFDYFMEEKYSLKNVIKMMLTEGIKPPQSEELLSAMHDPMGPPGGKYFAEMLAKEIPYTLSEEGLLWGVKATFGVVMHWGMMCCTDNVCDKSEPLMSPEQIRKDVESMIEAQLLYLASRKDKFQKL